MLVDSVPTLRVEHPGEGFRYFNVEPGFVYTEAMRVNHFGEEAAARFHPQDPARIARVICWLATSREALAYHDKPVIFAPQLLEQWAQADP